MDLLSITHFLNGFLMIVMPVLLGIILINKFKFGWKTILIGGSVFIGSQVFHLPFNFYALNPLLVNIDQSLPGISGILMTSILLGLSAGLFETFGRYAMFRWFLKDNLSWKVGILAGTGHGGIEAIILGSLVLLTYFNMMGYRNLDLSSLNLAPEQLNTAQGQIQMYWNMPWYDTLLGALERSFTIPLHIAASVLVLQVFIRKPGKLQYQWLGLAILLHTFADASAVFVVRQWGIYVTEAALGGLALICILIIFALRSPEPELSLTSPQLGVIQHADIELPPVEETPENLEQTRYQ